MSNGTSTAVSEAMRAKDLGFPEFTAKLISDTFDAVVGSYLRQMQAYSELVRQTALTLETFINETKDDISGEQILQFLAKIVPDSIEPSGTAVKPQGTLKVIPASLDGLTPQFDQAAELTKAVAVNVPGQPSPTFAIGPITESIFKTILDAVARRLAANKYDELNLLVKQGILRLYVDSGIIETKLTFTTFGSSFYESQSTKYHRDSFSVKAKAGTGAITSLFAKASASTSYSSLNISTAKTTDRDVSGSRVEIFGRVMLQLKSDFLPLKP
jgi:hypothetical protein